MDGEGETAAAAEDSTGYETVTTYYALLYSDGALVFQPDNDEDTEKESSDNCSLTDTYTITSSTSGRPWGNTYGDITSVTFTEGASYQAPASLSQWFYNCSNLEEVTNAALLDTSDVTSMQQMFYNCSSLTSLDVSDWNTSSVTDMPEIFHSCSSLTSLDVSDWDTGSVTNMRGMFYGCSALTSLDLSSWDVSAATTCFQMFYNCSALTSIDDVSSWNTSAVTTMQQMFYNCSSLTTLDASGWDTSSVTTFYQMFINCSSLTTLDASGWDTSAVTTFYQMFFNCSSLTSVGDVSSWDTSVVTNFSSMFYNCSALTFLDLSGWDTSAASSKSNMLSNLSALTTLRIGAQTNLSGAGLSPSYNWAQLSTAVTKTETDEDGNTYTYTDYTMVTSSEIMTLSADGSITSTETFSREATVSFYANGGTPSSEVTIYNGVVYGQDFTVTEPTRTGYTFAGWYTQRSGGSKLEEGYSLTVYYDSDGNEVEDSTLASSYVTTTYTSDGTVSDAPLVTQAIYYAQWTATSYTLVLMSNGGTGTDEDGNTVTSLSIPLDYGEFYSLDAAGFTYNGYVLSGWNTKRDGSGTSYDASAYVGNLTTQDGATVTLYAQWTASSYYATLHFDTVGNYEAAVAEMEASDGVASSEDIGSIPDTTVSIGSTLGLLSESACDGLSFVEWRIYLDETISGHADILSYIESLAEDGYDLHDAETEYDDDGNKVSQTVYDSYLVSVTEDSGTYSWTVVRETTTTYTYEYDEDGEVIEDSQTESDPVTVYYIVADEDVVVGSTLLDEENVLTLTAVWTGDISVVVSFDDGIGGGTVSRKKVQSGSSVGTLPEFASGYNGSRSLLGWYTAAQGDSGAEQVTEDTVLTATSDLLTTDEDGNEIYGVTYYAWWGWKPYFDTNGGKVTSDLTGNTVQESSVYLFTVPEAVRDGYTLTCWTLADGTILYQGVTYTTQSVTDDDGNVTTENCVIYNNVTYDSIDALLTAVGDNTLSYALAGNEVTIDLSAWGNTVTANWEAAETVTVTLNLSTGYISAAAEDGTISITSSDTAYITYTTNGSTYASDISYSYSTTLTLYSTGTLSGLYTPSLEGYTFLGWALLTTDEEGGTSYLTDADGSIVYITNGMGVSELLSLLSDSSVSDGVPYTLAAVFGLLQYTITYDPGDGSMYGSGVSDATVTESVAAGVYTGTVPGATLSNYDFVGWYTGCGDDCTGLDVNIDDESFTGSELVSGETEISGDVTYHAHYESKYVTYTLTDGDSSISFKYAVSWSNANTSDVDNVDGNLEFHPTTGANQTATLYIYFDLIEGEIAEAGAIQIYIPKDIWDGYGTTNISSQLAAYYDEDGNVLDATGAFSYYEYTDEETGESYYVIINNRAISAGFSVEISYTVNPLLLEGGAQDAEGNYIDGYEYYQAEVPVRIIVDIDTDDDEYDVDETITLSVELHTDVNPTASKSVYAKYTSWDESWGEEPEDAADYVYIVWALKASYTYNSQSVTYYWDEDLVHDGTIVKWLTLNSDRDLVPVTQTVYDEDGNVVYDEDGNVVTEEVTGTTSPTHSLSSSSGSTTDYVLIKYPAEYFTDSYLEENEGYTVENQAVLHSVWAAEMTTTDEEGNTVTTNYEETQAVYASKNYAYTTSEDSEEEEEDEETGGKGLTNKFSKTNSEAEVIYVSGAQEVLVNDEEEVDMVWQTTFSGGAIKNSWTVDDSGNVTLPVRTITITDGNSEEINQEDSDTTGITTGDLIYSSGAETDRYIWEPELGNTSLTDEDYEITYVSFKILEYRGTFSTTGTLGGISLINTVSDYGSVKIYIRTRGSQTYTLYKTVSVDSAGSYVEYKKVSLPSNTVGYKLVYVTQQYGTKIYTKANFSIQPSLHVQSLVGEDLTNDATSIFKNIAHCTVDQTTTTSSTDEETGETSSLTVTSTVFDTDNYTSASKSCETVIYELDKSESIQYTRKYAASTSAGYFVYDANTSSQDSANYLVAWNYNLTEGRKTYMSSGVFYDLLPKGTSVDSTTVFGMVLTENMEESDISSRTREYETLYEAWQNGDDTYEFLNQGLYDVQFVDDWEGSGRTMMIITWAAPEDTKITGIQFWYLLHTTHANIQLYGTTQTNDVAFVNTSSNVAVPVSLSGEQDVLEEEYESYFDALYSTDREEDYGYSSNFITYAVSEINYVPVSYNSWGFMKTVRGESSEYVESDVTTPGGDYSYKLTYSLTGTTTIQDIIFIDVLENGTDDQDTYWQGYFAGETTDSETDDTYLCRVENYATSDDEEEESGSGEGEDTDTSTPTCAPVIYYSLMDRDAFYTTGSSGTSNVVDDTYTSPDATYTDEDGNTQSVWILKATYEADTSYQNEDGSVNYGLVTAVMADCTKDTAGNDFVLGVDAAEGESSKSLTWEIHMTAPDEGTYTSIFDDGYETISDIYGLYATNEAFVFYTATTITSGSSESSSSSESTTYASGYKEDPAQISMLDISIAKESDPVSGTEEEPTEVYEYGSLSYIITVTNENQSASLSDIVVEDDNISDALEIDSIECRFYTSGAEPEEDEGWISLDSSPRISYTTQTVEASEDGASQSGTKYIFTINSLSKLEVVQIRINATVLDLSRIEDGAEVIQNTATITTVGSTEINLKSETTWHEVKAYELPETGSRTLLCLLAVSLGLLLISLWYRGRTAT